MRFIGNPTTGVYHDSHYLGERCNTDDARKGRGGVVESDTEFSGEVPRKRRRSGRPDHWRLCNYCAKNKAARQPA